MRIAYDHQVFSRQTHGGISRYFAELVQNLSQRESVEPTVIAPVHINEYLLRPGVRPKVRGWYFPFGFRGNARIARTLCAAMAPVAWPRETFDVVHETYYSKRPLGSSRVRVLTIYDMIHELFPGDFPDSAQVTAAKSAAARRADHIICISETTRQDAIRLLGIPPERSSVIYLGHSFDIRAGTQEPVIRRASCVLYVGPRGGYKNFSVLLDAYGSSRSLQTRLNLVAFGGAPFSEEEFRRINKYGIADRVHHVKGDDSVLSAYYRAAALFVYPSKYEGFGIPPLEAMACGCPVICSGAGSIGEVVDGAAAYFNPDDSEQLRTIMERLVDDTKSADELRARGFERIARFSWNECAEKTLRTYGWLLGEGSTPVPSDSGL